MPTSRLSALCAVPVAAFLTAMVVGCGGAPRGSAPQTTDAPADSSPTADRSANDATATDWFVDQAERSGLRFTHSNGMSGRFYFPEMLPAGAALLDTDNDGDLDVFLTQGRALDDETASAEKAVPDSPSLGRLFRNDLKRSATGTIDLRFTDVTDRSGIKAAEYGMGVAAGDIDNDGCIDLYLTNLGPNQLFRNRCDGTFVDVSKSSRTDDPGWSVSAAFFDYDRDGWLDLYVGNYVRWDLASDRPCTGLTGRRDYCTPAVYVPQGDRLYHNNKNGTFSDVTARALKGGPFGPALGVSTADFDGDGWIDVYVANDGRENVLWINQRDGTFANTGLLSGTALASDGRPKGSMGVDAGDFDNDGDDDLFTTQLPTEGNNVYVNGGHGLFEDRSAPTGLGPMSRGYTGFGAAWIDYDNDGWLDVFIANGAIEAIRERLGDAFPYGERKLLFRNRRDGTFENVSDQAGALFRVLEVSRGAAFGDIDNDGDIDALIANINSPARLVINTIGARAHWLGLRLTGTTGGRDMLGARVAVTLLDNRVLWRRVRTDGSYASANDPRVLVGLADATRVPRVRVQWPDGNVEVWRDVAVDRWTTLTQGSGTHE